MKVDFTLVPTLTLCAMMCALGMGLTRQDFTRLAGTPGTAAAGLCLQIVVLPAIAFVLTRILPLAPETATGLMLISACPGGTISNLVTRLAHGDVALSISLTAASSVLAPLTVPVVLGLAGAAGRDGATSFAALSTPDALAKLILTTAAPVVAGMALRHLRPRTAARVRRPLLGVATAMLLVLIAGLGVSTWRVQPDVAGMFARSIVAVLLLIVFAGAAAWLAGRLLGADGRVQRTLLLEVGIQNVNLALVVALGILGTRGILGATLVYLPVMLVFAGSVIGLSRGARPALARPS